jgi:hypothetical protein
MKLLASLTVFMALAASAWSQTQSDTLFSYRSKTPVTIDGQATEECWAKAGWHAIDQVWIPYNAAMKEGDFAGRFKATWDELYLYILVEITDDSLSDDHDNPLSNWWDDDCLEIFIDEDRSKGDHERNCNAFAYHVSLFSDAVDLNSSGQGVNYKANVEVDMDTLGENNYLWEFAIKNYSAAFNLNNPEESRVTLGHGKNMGLAIAYCDNDETTSRENFIGSMYMTSSHANDMYKNADYFGLMVLVDPDYADIGIDDNKQIDVNIYPVPSKNYLTVETPSANQTINFITITALNGQMVKNEFCTGNTHTINLDDLDAGMYLLVVKLCNSTCSQIIVKQ